MLFVDRSKGRITSMQNIFLSSKERAQGLVEYGLIIALVAVVAIAGLIVFGPAVSTLLSKVGGSV
jgi:Flp pilus assembly pilin Flp